MTITKVRDEARNDFITKVRDDFITEVRDDYHKG